MKKGKRYVESAKLVDRTNLYDVEEAVSIIKKTANAKFDETIEAHIKLGVDGRHADQQVRGAVVLPHGTGKKVRVLVFAKGDKVEEAQAAGADFVGGQELVPKIQNEGWLDFDVVVATPDMMGVVGRLGRVLGPKGLMPNPKAGTVTMDVTKAVNDIKAGKIEYRLDKTNIIHVPVGKASFTEEQLADNFHTLMGAIVKAKPAAAKGMNAENDIYVRRLAHRMQACMVDGSLHLEGFARFRLADLRRRWQKCIERVVSMAVLRYDWAQQLDAWRIQISQSTSRCRLVRVHKNLKGQFVLEVQGYQGEPPGLPEEQPAEEALLSMLLSWAPECIEIQLGENRQESWVYEIIEQVFGPRVKIRWCQH